MSVSLDQLLAGIRQQESGGNYKVVNSIGATGAYQVMANNIPSWTKEALGHPMTQQEFINSPTAQDAVARYEIGKNYQKYGPEGAAAMWYSGQPNPNSSASSPGAPTVRQYVNQVIAKASGSGAGIAGGTPSTTSGSTADNAGLLGDIGGDIFSSLWNDTKPMVFTGLAIFAGLGLVVAGVVMTAAPSVREGLDQAQQQTQQMASSMPIIPA